MTVICDIFGECFEYISLKSLSSKNQMRAFKILDTFKEFLCERKHSSLCIKLMNVLPKLFAFESCAVLFVDS